MTWCMGAPTLEESQLLLEILEQGGREEAIQNHFVFFSLCLQFPTSGLRLLDDR